ncbi:MAG: histidinol dehydrogenase [Candidatus Xiphinematobacter sp.]|nr:MAG: histidinol dehydrogenase [Candidatus Xiphinematobacter sp.]
MKILRYTDSNFDERLSALNRTSQPKRAVQSCVHKIIQDVRQSGDLALLHYTKKFGGGELEKKQLRVDKQEIASAVATLTPPARRAILAARTNLLKFARKTLRKNWSSRNMQGAMIGERFDPLDRVGIYVPGGTTPLISSGVMTCTLAMAAGVQEIVVATPGRVDGSLSSSLLAALSLCGATEIYRIGGAQAIAALAYGTKTIASVRKVFGPGNPYVVEAKRQVFGWTAVDLLPGPSEILVIADAVAQPDWIAADLLAQSEHGLGSVAVLLTDAPQLLDRVHKSIRAQAKLCSRKAQLRDSLKNACLILCKEMSQCIQIANAFSSEHVSVATCNPEEVAGQLVAAGSIFLGGISPVAAGDFLAGLSHELPTGGAGKSFSGLMADQFQRRTSILCFDEDSLLKSWPFIDTLCQVEGLDAHAHSASVRLPRKK